jgi:hypothetical protein
MAFEYTVDSSFDYTIDEKGNTYIALRKIDWGNKGDYKLDLRKYYASGEGEKMAKGVSFGDDAADELVKVLLDTGYGDDMEVANSIIENRPYILGKIKMELDNNPFLVKRLEKEVIPNIDNEEEEFYDPEELMA